MRKVITLGLVSALSTMLLVGCSSTPAPSPSSEANVGEIHKQHTTMKQIHKIIIKAGEEAGWKMTEFKRNTIIAENIDAGKTVTITFDNSSFDISPSNSSLQSAISDALK